MGIKDRMSGIVNDTAAFLLLSRVLSRSWRWRGHSAGELAQVTGGRALASVSVPLFGESLMAVIKTR